MPCGYTCSYVQAGYMLCDIWPHIQVHACLKKYEIIFNLCFWLLVFLNIINMLQLQQCSVTAFFTLHSTSYWDVGVLQSLDSIRILLRSWTLFVTKTLPPSVLPAGLIGNSHCWTLALNFFFFIFHQDNGVSPEVSPTSWAIFDNVWLCFDFH